jgi:Tol biopolymer transport system component
MTGEKSLMHRFIRFCPAVATAAGLLMAGLAFAATPKMPAAKAGTIAPPTGKIAFIRNHDIWAMDVTGANQRLITRVGVPGDERMGASGRLSWAPDGRRIAFTWSGFVDTKLPAGEGGVHRVYDIFVAYLDSAANNNTAWWRRLTTDLGSMDPEWSVTGDRIIFAKDLNANYVNASGPNYEICSMDDDGGEYEIFRKDWQNVSGWMKAPSVNPRGEIAFVLYASQKQAEGSMINPAGIAVLPRANMMAPIDSIARSCIKIPLAVAPAWSPDGKWLAYVNNQITDGGLYLSSSDYKDQYLVFAPPVSINMATFQPSFSPDSKWLTFGTNDGSVWICDITGNGAKRLSGPGADMGPAWSKAARK